MGGRSERKWKSRRRDGAEFGCRNRWSFLCCKSMPEPTATRILLADDHGLIRDALPVAIRKRVPGATFVGVGTAAEVVAAVEREAWSLVVLYLGLPGSAGELATLKTLRALRPEIPVLVLSMFSEEKFGVAAIEAGAAGYLAKTADRAAIGEAVAEVLAGRGYRTAALQAQLDARHERDRRGIGALSPRELDVLLALARGASNKEISARLKVGVTTVATYRARLLEKLGLRTTADLLRYVVEHRLTRD